MDESSFFESREECEVSYGYHISVLHRFWRMYMDRALAPLGFGSGQVPILTYLFERDGVQQADIVRHLRMDKGSIARTIRKLVDQGYIERLPSEDDRRAYHIRVTDKGRSVREELNAILLGWSETLSQDLSTEERTHLFDMLTRMRFRAGEMLRRRMENDQ